MFPPPVLILECGYINGDSGSYHERRLARVSTSWNKLHGEALKAPERPDDRWVALGIDLPVWRDLGAYTLILGQVQGDATVPRNYAAILAGITKAAGDTYGPVRVRPHPLIQKPTRTLEEDLSYAARAVTWTSNSAVDAVLAGVPTIAFNWGCMAWPVTSHALCEPHYVGNRLPWCYDLSYRQWTHDELRTGHAWEHLSYGI